MSNLRNNQTKTWDPKKQAVTSNRYKRQEKLIYLQGYWEDMISQLKQLREEYKIAQEILVKWNEKYDVMLKRLGFNVQNPKIENGMAIYPDGAV